MEYFAQEQKIILLNKAHVRQSGDTFSSDKINYDIAKDIVTAGDGSPSDRVHITIQPKAKVAPKTDAAEAAPATPAPATKAEDAP